MQRPALVARLEAATGTAAITRELYVDSSRNGRSSTVLDNTSTESKQFKTARAAIRAQVLLLDQDGDEDALKRLIDEFVAKDHKFISSSVLSRRTRISNLWLCVAQFFDNSVNVETLYHYDTVKKHLERFLPLAVRSTICYLRIS